MMMLLYIEKKNARPLLLYTYVYTYTYLWMYKSVLC